MAEENQRRIRNDQMMQERERERIIEEQQQTQAVLKSLWVLAAIQHVVLVNPQITVYVLLGLLLLKMKMALLWGLAVTQIAYLVTIQVVAVAKIIIMH